jgi:hypothetical protein
MKTPLSALTLQKIINHLYLMGLLQERGRPVRNSKITFRSSRQAGRLRAYYRLFFISVIL